MKPREIILPSGTKIFLGKNAENNEELVKEFIGKENIILHTEKPGSPFCVMDKLNPTNKELLLSGAVCAGYSQDWRDNKGDVRMHVFRGKDIYKNKLMKSGTFGLKKFKVIKIKKKDIEKLK